MKKTCERCGRSLKRRRVTCCKCGRRIGLWYDCGCSMLWTESGPARYFCDGKGERSTPQDCTHARNEKVKNLSSLRATFLTKMKRLNGRWP